MVHVVHVVAAVAATTRSRDQRHEYEQEQDILSELIRDERGRGLGRVTSTDTIAVRRYAPGEETPLLGGATEGSCDGSEETLAGDAGGDAGDAGDADGSVDHDKANQEVGRARGLFIIVSLWGLIFLQASNISIITVTQSIIAEELDAFTEASWFTSAYLIGMSSCAPLAGRLATIFSPRSCIFGAAMLFSLGGLITANAPSLTVFLLGRAVSGVGGAGIMTISFVLVLELTGRKKRGLYIGLANTGFTIGVSTGAVIAGALVGITGWRFLFGIQTPLAIVAGVGIFFSIPKHFTSGPKNTDDESMISKLSKIDYLGAILLTSPIVLFLFGLSWPQIQWLPIIISLVLLPAFIFYEIYIANDPIIPVSVLKSRGALLSCIAQMGIMASRWMVLFYTPVYSLSIRGWSPATAGSILVPTNAGFALGGILAGAFHIKRAGSFWSACIICYALFSMTLILLAFISTETTPAWLYILSTFINGLFTGAALNYTLAHVLHLTPPNTHYIVTSLLNTFRGFAGSFGSAIGGGLFVRILKKGLESGFAENGIKGKEELVRRLLGSPALVQGLRGVEKVVAVEAYGAALKGLFLAGSGVACVMALVQAGTGWKKGVVTREGRGGSESESESEGESERGDV